MLTVNRNTRTDQGRIDVLVHPAMRGLLHWKFESYGDKLMKAEFALYVLWLLCLSLSLLLLPERAADSTALETCAAFRLYEGTAGTWRKVLEPTTLALQVLVLVVHARDAYQARKKSGKQVTAVPARCCCCRKGDKKKAVRCRLPTLSGVLALLPHVAMAWAVALRLSGASERHEGQCGLQLSLVVGADFLGWLR